MTPTGDDARRALMALQDGIVDLVTPGMDISDRKQLRDIWFQARSIVKDTTLDDDEEVEKARALSLRAFTRCATAIAEKYNRALNTENPDPRRDPFKDLDRAFFIVN
ncbi:hypothetical protein NJBCHELONAE_43230 [Mycobacteroides chelonae]|uniref:hypothetical protein n=1 Tax=Mycobacteroides chelonae TaxID=1774 RepID=UPI0021DE43CC|nr:hypothetical protein [Mycobacteroides chelonae]GLE59012.1 hypothetical protein NJBCHELONAE_43230 [Mycobacteroides chelonae]